MDYLEENKWPWRGHVNITGIKDRRKGGNMDIDGQLLTDRQW